MLIVNHATSECVDHEPTNTEPGFFNNSHNFVVNNPTMHIHNDPDIIPRGKSRLLSFDLLINASSLAMKLLSKRGIRGAEFDSSARDPPPRCHPGTRTKLIEKIHRWFHDKRRRRALLWLNGPAGVGKSAVVQTFAESLARSQRLGASVFFSRPNKRNDPQRVFITIAYQLAVRIPSYRSYIAEKLELDPGLLDKGMKEQFRIFIKEPFADHNLGEGEDAWGILLDGLDECQGQDPQCELIQLISAFVLEYPHVPLLWAISSRPEPHITTTFADETILNSHWQEYIPVDSTQACQDVERYLHASFNTIRKRFPRSVPSHWPSEAQFLKLTTAASGLFVFAAVTIRFVEDSDYGNPALRLDLVLSAIDHLKVTLGEDQPFTNLDVLYTQILKSVPSTLWPMAKRILGFALCSRSEELETEDSFTLHSRCIMAMSQILNIEQSDIYGALHKLYSVLDIPPPKRIYTESITFFHASFADYLTDPTRSKQFYISLDETIEDVIDCLCKIMQSFLKESSGHMSKYNISVDYEGSPLIDLNTSSGLDTWFSFCQRYHSKNSSKKFKQYREKFDWDLLCDTEMASSLRNPGRGNSGMIY